MCSIVYLQCTLMGMPKFLVTSIQKLVTGFSDGILEPFIPGIPVPSGVLKKKVKFQTLGFSKKATRFSKKTYSVFLFGLLINHFILV